MRHIAHSDPALQKALQDMGADKYADDALKMPPEAAGGMDLSKSVVHERKESVLFETPFFKGELYEINGHVVYEVMMTAPYDRDRWMTQVVPAGLGSIWASHAVRVWLESEEPDYWTIWVKGITISGLTKPLLALKAPRLWTEGLRS